MSDSGASTPPTSAATGPEQAPPPVPTTIVNPAPTAAEAFPDSIIQAIVGGGGQPEPTTHYRSKPED